VAQQLGADLQVIRARPDLMSGFDAMIWHLDEAQGDIAPLLLQQITAQAREQNIQVLISGAGADDIFSGYRRHQALAFENQISRVPQVLRKGMKHLLHRIPESPYTRRWKKMGPLMALHLFREEYREQIDRRSTEQYFERLHAEIPGEQNNLNRMLYYELRSFLPDHNLNYTDKMAMASGVEVRVPYLDPELVRWAMALPPALKMKGTVTKYILRQVAQKYLPAR
jgi:asparagine synthase (glutamine-hydrolysing)